MEKSSSNDYIKESLNFSKNCNVLVICLQDTEVYLGEIFNHDDSTNDRSPNSKLSGKWLLVYCLKHDG